MTLDIPRYTVKHLPFPTDWNTVFPNADRPLILEIGFGQGEFLHHLSQKYPDHNIIGLESSHVCMEKAERAIERGLLPNVRVAYGEAETALHHVFEPETLDMMVINYPDPWFKDRHSHRRLMQRDTLDAMVSRLKPGADWYLATDIIEYAEMSAELLADTAGLTNLLPAPWASEMAGRTITKYERIAREEGRPGHYFHYKRNQHPAPDVPVLKDLDMPNMVIESPLTLDEMLENYHPHQYKIGRIAVNYKFAYRGDYSLLVEVFVHEPTIEQRNGLIVTQQRDKPNHYTVRMASLGDPRPTQGMHVAVKHLGEFLVEQHPDARVLQNKVRREHIDNAQADDTMQEDKEN